MKIALFANTPAQAHFHKNLIKKLHDNGHETRLLIRDYGETVEVTMGLGVDYMVYGQVPNSKIGKISSMPLSILNAYRALYRFKPDLIVGFGVYDAYASALLRAWCIEFGDSEPTINRLSFSLQLKLYLPFVDAIVTPRSFNDDLGKNHIRVNSFKELAYLHPRYYSPDPGILDLLGLGGGDDYALLRFNAFDAVHDFGIGGFSDEDKIRLARDLQRYARVFISSETGVPDELKHLVIRVPKDRIHDVIYYAKILVTDTQTMATEAALLGTPTVRCNRFVGKNDMSNFIELEEKYGLVFNYRDPDEAIRKAAELIVRSDIKRIWRKKADKLIGDKIDIMEFMVSLIESYS